MPLTVIKPPQWEPKRIFLAGSIEMGAAEDWQARVEELLKDEDVTLFSPRRDDWDSSWEQSIHCRPFVEQVTWELDHMERADAIFMYFDPNTKSPVTMAEFGAFAASGKLLVCCPEGFWRKGNIDVMVNWYKARGHNLREFRTLEAMVQHVFPNVGEPTHLTALR